MTRVSFLLVALAASSAALAMSCSWSRFDDVRSDPPVVLLDRPDNVTAGFATSVASVPSSSTLLVGGQPLVAGAALFRVGDGDPPSSPARTFCVDPVHCRLLGSPAGISSTAGSDCFVYAIGKTSDDVKGSLLGSCGSGSDFTLEVPPIVESKVIETLLSPAIGSIAFLDGVSLASSGPLLAAGSPDVGLAWVYGPTKNLLATLPTPPGADGSFGVSTAITAADSGGSVVAVSAAALGQVYVYDVGADGTTSMRGCVTRGAPWGVVMTMATQGTRTALVVADGSTGVDILDLSMIPTGATCVDPSPALVHQVHCVPSDDASGCAGGGFGHSIAAADVNGDGTLELLVGVPGMNVRSVNNAGAVQVFTLFGDDQPRDTLFVTSAKGEDHLGMSLAALRIGGRDVVAAGMPGTERQEVALFYCSALPGAGSSSPRCQ